MRGRKSPLFLGKMISRKTVVKLANQRIKELNNGTYLVDVEISRNNVITVKVDNLNGGISINDCVSVSRNVEHNLDRDEVDFELKVTSPGLDQPFMVMEQYHKNLGNKINVITKNNMQFSGELERVNEEEISLKEINSKRDKKTKKKETIEMVHKIKINEIKETKLIISF